ncbi:MAG: dTDP-4-dehydrorhamnose 3,5-epimerase [Candidatus Rokuibacteriota bacterium]
MTFSELRLPGVFLIEPERHEDERGFFARTWCAEALAARGLDARIAQCSVSVSKRAGTLRGMHYQAPPHAETKLVRCTRGAIHDVVIDLRPASPTFLQHATIALSAEGRASLYVPAGLAHGFQTLEDDTEVFYQMSVPHAPGHARGIRWDDPRFAIRWPPAERTISARDRAYPDFEPEGGAR